MSAPKNQPKQSLAALRGYIYLLITSITILSFALLVYLYWQNDRRHELESVSNQYHLATILHCAEIQEDLHRIVSLRTDDPVHIQHSERQHRSQNAYTNAIYLLEKRIQAIRQLTALRPTQQTASSRFYARRKRNSRNSKLRWRKQVLPSTRLTLSMRGRC